MNEREKRAFFRMVHRLYGADHEHEIRFRVMFGRVEDKEIAKIFRDYDRKEKENE